MNADTEKNTVDRPPFKVAYEAGYGDGYLERKYNPPQDKELEPYYRSGYDTGVEQAEKDYAGL